MSMLKQPFLTPMQRYEQLKHLEASQKTTQVRLEFRFVSLISPSWQRTESLLQPEYVNSVHKFRRILMKKSYLILSWFSYLSAAGDLNKSRKGSSRAVKLAILPARRKMYTLTKAPMAHKTNSKEQFLLKFSNFKFSINLDHCRTLLPSSPSSTAHQFLLLQKIFPVFETNLLLLKYYILRYPGKGTSYFRALR